MATKNSIEGNAVCVPLHFGNNVTNERSLGVSSHLRWFLHSGGHTAFGTVLAVMEEMWPNAYVYRCPKTCHKLRLVIPTPN